MVVFIGVDKFSMASFTWEFQFIFQFLQKEEMSRVTCSCPQLLTLRKDIMRTQQQGEWKNYGKIFLFEIFVIIRMIINICSWGKDSLGNWNIATKFLIKMYSCLID